MSELNVGLAAVGGLVLVIGLLSGSVRRSLFSGPLVALMVGVLLGPAALGLLDPASWGSQETMLEQAAVSESDRAEEERVPEAVNRFFILPIFVLLGMTIPWKEWLELGPAFY